MKYLGHEIKKVASDLGERKAKDNFVYKIYKDGKYINVAITLSSAKEFISSGYNPSYL